MEKTKTQNKHLIFSAWIIGCGLVYIFAYQFNIPLKADVFLYGMLVGLVAMTLLVGRIIISKQFILFLSVVLASFIGILHTTNTKEGIREFILFIFFAGLVVFSIINPRFIESFTKWIYLCSIVVVLSSILHFILPSWFNGVMSRVLRENAYEQLMESFTIDNTFAGIAAYTSNATFAASIVFGHSFLNITNKNDNPIIKNKLINILLLALSMFSIIICSKRGIFVATLVAMIAMMFYLYRGKKFVLKFIGIAVLFTVVLVMLYRTNDFVSAFLDRFATDDFTTGRDDIYKSLIADFKESNILFGRGTGATYNIAEKGAHNIYLQILYDHGIVFSIPYYIFFVYNYYLAFKNKCPLSVFVQTLFLVYGLSGNPLYSNMFVMIYIYYSLYAERMPQLKNKA